MQYTQQQRLTRKCQMSRHFTVLQCRAERDEQADRCSPSRVLKQSACAASCTSAVRAAASATDDNNDDVDADDDDVYLGVVGSSPRDVF